MIPYFSQKQTFMVRKIYTQNPKTDANLAPRFQIQCAAPVYALYTYNWHYSKRLFTSAVSLEGYTLGSKLLMLKNNARLKFRESVRIFAYSICSPAFRCS